MQVLCIMKIKGEPRSMGVICTSIIKTGISLQIKEYSEQTFTLWNLLIYRDESFNWKGLIGLLPPLIVKAKPQTKRQ